MIKDLTWKTFKMEELILEEEVIHLVLKIWDIYFKCLWEAEWVEWAAEEEEEAEAEDSLVLISIPEVQVKANNSLSDSAEKL